MPYSEATVTESYDVFRSQGDTWMIITSVVGSGVSRNADDRDGTVRKEANGSGWEPRHARRAGDHDVGTAVTVLALFFLLLATSASAQVDLSGTWALRNFSDALMTAPGAGPLPVDFMGLPLSDAGRARALAHDPSEVSAPDHICIPYSPPYIMMARSG